MLSRVPNRMQPKMLCYVGMQANHKACFAQCRCKVFLTKLQLLNHTVPSQN